MRAYRQSAPQKPPPAGGAPAVCAGNIPRELRDKRAWVVWRYEKDATGRWSKLPYNPTTGERAKSSHASTWSEFDECYNAYVGALPLPGDTRPWDGVSFALDLRWGVVGIDLDHLSAHRSAADRIVRELNSYAELTPSGDGLRIFCRGTLPEGRRRRDWVEMYVKWRFLTVTGQRLENVPDVIQPSPHFAAGVALVGAARWLNA